MGNGHIAGEHDKRLGFPAGQGLYQLPVLGERHAQDDHRKWLQGEEVERLLDRRGIETSVSSAWMAGSSVKGAKAPPLAAVYP